MIHSFISAIGKITSYGNVARTLLAYVCGRGGNEIHLLFDTYHPILIGIIRRHLTSQRRTAYSCIIMDCGSVNSRRHIDVISIARAEAKQKGLAAAMPGLHSFTCSDFITAFYMKGKIKPREVLENDTEGTLIRFFSRIVSEDQPDWNKVE